MAKTEETSATEVAIDLDDDLDQGAGDSGAPEGAGDGSAPAKSVAGKPRAGDDGSEPPSPEAGADAGEPVAGEGGAAAAGGGESLAEQLGPEYAGLSDEQIVQKLEAEQAEEERAKAELPRLREYARQLEQAQQDARFRQIAEQTVLARQQAEQQRWQAEQQRQQQAAEQNKWQAPDFDPAWLNQLLRNDKGDIAPPNQQPPGLLEKIQAWSDHRNKIMDRLARDPDAFLQERLGSYVQQQVNENVHRYIAQQQQQVAQQQEAKAVYDFESTYATTLYYDHGKTFEQGGMRNLTPVGQAVVQRAGLYMQNGIRNRAFAAQKAFQDLYNEALIAQQTQPARPGAPVAGATAPAKPLTQQQKRDAFLRDQANKNKGNRGRGAGRANGVAVPRTRQDFEKMMAEELAKDGISLEQPLAI